MEIDRSSIKDFLRKLKIKNLTYIVDFREGNIHSKCIGRPLAVKWDTGTCRAILVGPGCHRREFIFEKLFSLLLYDQRKCGSDGYVRFVLSNLNDSDIDELDEFGIFVKDKSKEKNMSVQSIVIEIADNGNLRPSANPMIHPNEHSASSEATILANKFPGTRFAVFNLQGVVKTQTVMWSDRI